MTDNNKNVANIDIHALHLIELIYETAVDAEKWTDLVDALAHFVETVSEQSISASPELEHDTGLPQRETGRQQDESGTLTEALQYLGQTGVTSLSVLPATGTEQQQINQLLLGHFNKALNIAKQLLDLEDKHETTISILDQLPIALIVVNHEGRVLHTNRQVTEVLNGENELIIDDGYLRIRSQEAWRGLEKAIHYVDGGTANDPRTEAIVLSSPDPDLTDLMLILNPAHSGDSYESNHVAIFISPTKSISLHLPETLKKVYALTEKEFMITNLMVQGFSIKEIAEKNCTSQHTVRSQLKSIFGKTHTQRQAELVALLLGGSAAIIGREVPAQDDFTLKDRGLVERPQFFTLADGRTLSYQEYGDTGGYPVIYCHSSLGSRLELPLGGDAEAARRKLRIIIPDRPGRGRSDPNLNGSLLDWADDLRQLADHLEIKSFAIIGYAISGLFANTCAYKMPQRVKRVVLISSGFAPRTQKDFLGMQPIYRLIQKLARDYSKAHRFVTAIMSKSFTKNSEKFIDRLGQRVCAADKKVLARSSFRKLLSENLNEAYAQGAAHCARALELAMGLWGFEPRDISVPMELWHGELDNSIPVILGEKFHRNAVCSTFRKLPGKGHFLIYDHWPQILDSVHIDGPCGEGIATADKGAMDV